MSSTAYLIKSVDDIINCPQFGFQDRGKSISIHAVIDGQQKPLMLSLGSKPENLGLVVEKIPDEVKVSVSGSAWEKEKLHLRLQRDSDKQVMETFNTIARGLYDVAKGDLDQKDWFNATDNFGILKVKIHPTQTLYSTDAVEWRHIGTGETYVVVKKKRIQEPLEKKEAKKRKKADNGTVDTSALLGGAINNAVVDTHKLLSTMAPNKQHHYKLYSGDQICTTLEVGDIWSMVINGKESCGITIKARHMMVLSQKEQGKEEEEEEEEEEEDLMPGMNVFA
jgi:hypothetical protein